jgi:exodeoxyribonuclease-3
VDCYSDLITKQPSVIIGDFNSNRLWDYKRPPDLNHTGLVRKLEAMGISSAYHDYFSEEHGAETRPTLYFRKSQQQTYHIDYCFLPTSWRSHMRSVEVGSYNDWISSSDHVPLCVELDIPRSHRRTARAGAV